MDTVNFLITDTHFGVKQNSITWLNYQLEFIYEQLIPDIKQYEQSNTRLIHLGDVFDSRSSISTMVATKVVKALKDLAAVVDEFIIIAGNHDFYSPNSDEIDTLTLLLKDTNIKLVTKEVYESGDSIYMPWYTWGQDISKYNIKNIFAHTDIITQPIPYHGVNIFSGHLHIPNLKGSLYNLGSCYALNFADSNQERGYYIFKNNELIFYPNTKSIKFWRLYNDDIFKDVMSELKKDDYIEVYITQSNMLRSNFIHKVNELLNMYKNIWIIPQTEENIGDNLTKFEGYDIEEITRGMIPDELKKKFQMVLNSQQKSIIME
jgi:predicted phosphodiesterase